MCAVRRCGHLTGSKDERRSYSVDCVNLRWYEECLLAKLLAREFTCHLTSRTRHTDILLLWSISIGPKRSSWMHTGIILDSKAMKRVSINRWTGRQGLRTFATNTYLKLTAAPTAHSLSTTVVESWETKAMSRDRAHGTQSSEMFS